VAPAAGLTLQSRSGSQSSSRQRLMVFEGVGIVRFGDNVVARAIQAGLLEPLLQDWEEPENFPLWAILPPGRQRAPKVKVFLDFLAERFGSAPWRRVNI
jgi:DNA-binding transcriptional LysR family regulator